MKKVRVKANAKVNLTLDVTGVKDGYHMLDSIVASVKLHDAITLKKRRDDKVTLTLKGIKIDCDEQKNTAYKSAVLYKEKFNASGVDIIINKKIIIGGGLGGSSADIAGVLNGLNKLFNLNCDVKPLADSLGSDSGYMLTGGFARISGRGEIVSPIKTDKTIYLLLLSAKTPVTAKQSYDEYDKLAITYPPVAEKGQNALEKGNDNEFLSLLKNDLYLGSIKVCPEIESNLNLLKSVAPAVMTGSGSCTLGVFFDKKQRNGAYKKLKKMGVIAIKTQTC